MSREVFAKNLSTDLRIIGALYQGVVANIKVPLQVTPLYFLDFTVLIWTLDREFQDEPADGNVRFELSDDSHITKRAAPSVLDTLLTEQVMTARSLYSILEDIKTDWADPPVICEALRREVREALRSFKLFDA